MFEILFKPKTFCQTIDGLYEQYNQWGGALDNVWWVRFLRRHFPNNSVPVNFFGSLGTPLYQKGFSGN